MNVDGENKADSRSGVLAAGNFIIDQVKLIDAWPEQDALATILGVSRANGGGPYNLLKDLARLGAPFPLAAAGRVGEDENGNAIRAELGDLGVDHSRMLGTPGAPTPFTDVMTVAGSGRRTFFYHPGANAYFGEDDLQFGVNEQARFFYLGYLLLLDRLDERAPDGSTGSARLLERARAAGFRTVVDLVSGGRERFSEVVPPALPHTDLLFLNEYEASCLLGREVAPESGPMESAAREVLGWGVPGMVIIHAASGAVAVTTGGESAFQGSVRMPPEEIRGANGAGDAFAAGVLYGLHEGWDLERALRTGACVAAACLRDATTSGGIPPLAEALALGERMGFQPF